MLCELVEGPIGQRAKSIGWPIKRRVGKRGTPQSTDPARGGRAPQVEWDQPEALSPEPSRPAKRQRSGDDSAADFDVELDQSTAWALGFTPDAVTAEEEDLLPPGSQEAVYVTVCPRP